MKTLLVTLLLASTMATALAQNDVEKPARPASSKNDLPNQELSDPEQNYQISVEIKDSKDKVLDLKVVTMAGKFKVQTISRQTVKIDDNEFPVTITVDGTLDPMPGGRCRLMLFVGRTRPYPSSSVDGPSGRRSQIQQTQLGFNTTVILSNGKPLVVQSEENQQLTLTLKAL